MPNSIFSFFSGTGLLDLGFELERYNIVFVNEYEKSFLDGYIYARQGRRIAAPRYGYHQGDINQFLKGRPKTTLLSNIAQERAHGNRVGFIGGPPCPDFSVGGKNLGKDGKNGILAQSYVDLIIKCKPDFFVFENVKGLVKTAKHRAYFEDLKKQLKKAGYVIADKVLNSLCFGVPQDRERVILIGLYKKRFTNISNCITTEKSLDFPWMANAVFDDYEKIKKFDWPTTRTFAANQRYNTPRNIPKEYRRLMVETWFRKNHVTVHPNAQDVFRVKGGLSKIQTIAEGDVSRKSFKRLHRWRYSPTAAYGNNEVHLHPYQIRRISVAEAMAIQSLPEWFVLPPNMSLTHKFKTIGNGVPVLMARAIAKTLATVLINAN